MKRTLIAVIVLLLMLQLYGRSIAAEPDAKPNIVLIFML